MEVYTKEDKFIPVYIKLDTQEELNTLFAIFNFSPIIDSFDGHRSYAFVDSLRRELSGYKTNEHDEFYRMLQSNIGRRH